MFLLVSLFTGGRVGVPPDPISGSVWGLPLVQVWEKRDPPGQDRTGGTPCPQQDQDRSYPH